MNIDRIIAAIAILFAGAYFYETQQIELLAFGDPIGPRLFPYVVGALFTIGALVLIFESTRRSSSAQPAPAVATRAENQVTRRVYRMIAAIGLWMLLYILAFERAGYVLSSIVFLIGLTFYFHPRKWVVNAAISILLPIAIYVVFHNFLHVSLPAGLLSL